MDTEPINMDKSLISVFDSSKRKGKRGADYFKLPTESQGRGHWEGHLSPGSLSTQCGSQLHPHRLEAYQKCRI